MAPLELHFRLAAEPDVSAVLEILTEAARWEIAKGFPNPWPVPFPADRVLPSLERHELFLVEDAAGHAIGTVTLQWEDVPFWGVRPPDAGYVHRLAVRRTHAGQGVGKQILAWAERQAVAKGRVKLRLDCLTASPGLHRFYESVGFARVGEVTQGGLDCTLFEKALETPPGATG